MTLPMVQDFVQIQLNQRTHKWTDWVNLCHEVRQNPDYEGSFVGAYSLTSTKLKTTFVSDQHKWIDAPVSASSVARRILYSGLKQLNRKRIPWNKRAFKLLDIPQPLYCIPLEGMHELYYWDITSCYYEIYRRMPFDFWFNGHHALGGNLMFADFLPQDLRQYKLVRNSLIGVIRVRESTTIRNFRPVSKPNKNPLLSPYHWGYIANLLHLFANLARELGATYYNTDGAIFTNRQAGEQWAEFMLNAGFVPNLAQVGTGIVRGIGRYKIGRDAVGAQLKCCRPVNNLIEVDGSVFKYWQKIV